MTCISTCGVDGCLFGTLRSQLVAVLLVQSPVVKAFFSAGLVELGATVTAMDPSAAAEKLLQTSIRNRIVPPACTLAAEAVTRTSAVGFGVGVGVGVVVLVVGFGVGVGVEVGGSLEPAELPPPDPELGLLEPVLLGVGVGVGVALVVGSAALGELDAWVAVALLEADEVVAAEEVAGAEEVAAAEEVAGADELAERAEADGLGDADGEVAAMAVPVTPLEITNRPVARPTVTGRECADRMRTPCLWLLSRLENVLSRTLCHSGGSGWPLIAYAPIRHQNRRLVPPLHHT